MAVSSFEELILPQLETEMFQITQQYEQKYIDSEEAIKHLEKRSFPTLNVKGTKKRTCQNMNGILGGSNAFNFMSFVAGVITLVSFNKHSNCPVSCSIFNFPFVRFCAHHTKNYNITFRVESYHFECY